MEEIRTDDAEEYREPTEAEVRFERVKILRIEKTSFADMVPILIAEGLISTHKNHKPKEQGRRSPERNAEVCARCENLIYQQYRQNLAKLAVDEIDMLDARFTWRTDALRQIVRYEALAVAPIVSVTTVRRRIEHEGETEEKPAFVVETTTREERRSNPAYFRMADELREKIAQLQGVPVGELSKIPSGAGTRSARRQLVVGKREDRAGAEPKPN